MRTVRPIEPIRPIRGVRRMTLRYVPSIKQLRMWLTFARQKAKDRPKGRPAPPQVSGQPAADPSELSADWESTAETGLAADHGHIDKPV